MNILLKDVPEPLYSQVAVVLRAQIVAGRWATGEQIPTLPMLMTEFAVGRVTIRQALALLERDGLVSSRRGRGTFVTNTPERPSMLTVETSKLAVLANLRGDVPRLLKSARAKTPPAIKQDDARPAAHYHQLIRVHSKDDTPYLYIQIWLESSLYLRAPKKFRTRLVIPVLETLSDVKITSARQTLTIGTAGIEAAKALGLSLNAPVGHLHRILVDDTGTALYVARLTYRGDRVQLDMNIDWRPAAPNQRKGLK